MNSLWNKFLTSLSGFLDKHINLRRGERKKVLLLQANIFIIISVLLILKPIFTSIMLSFHGVNIMPIAYISIAVSAVIVHSLLNRMSQKYLLIKTMIFNHTFNIITLFATSYLLFAGMMTGVLSILLYVYVSLFALITVTYFYQYCQSLLTIRDAKRIYAYIGSGAIAGGVFGGYFTSVLIPFVGNAGLVLFSAVLLIISGGIIIVLNNLYKEDRDNTLILVNSDNRTRSTFRALSNNHVFNISMIIGLGVLVSKLIDYQFNYIAYTHISDEKELTSFFGFWFSTINVIGLLIQVFFVSKLIDRLGVTKSIAIMPVFLLFGSALVIIFPVLAFAILVKLLEGSLKQSLYKTSTEINIMPLGPSLRNTAKTLVDIVIDSLATGIAGLLIYFLINQGQLDFLYVGVLTLISITFWLYFVIRSKGTYTDELAKMVSGSNQNMIESERIGSTAKKFYLDDYLKSNKQEQADPKDVLFELTKHKKPTVRKAAILRYVKDYKLDSIHDLIHCTKDESLSVRKAVFFALIMLAKTEREVELIYKNQTPINNIIITAALAEAIGNNGRQKRLYKIHYRIDEAFRHLSENLLLSKSTELYGELFKAITVSKYFARYNSIAEAVVNSIDDKLQKVALKAIGYGKAARLFETLVIEEIAADNLPIFLRVLAQFPNRLLVKAKKLTTLGPRYINKYLPAFAFVDDQRHVDFLFTQLDVKSLKTRRVALRAINDSRKTHTHLSFNNRKNYRRLKKEIRLLKGICAAMLRLQNQQESIQEVEFKARFEPVKKGLLRQANKTILNVFIYLSLITQKEEMKTIYTAIKSSRKDAALDYLDGILDYNLRKFVLPVLEVVVKRRFTETDLKSIRQVPFTERKMIGLLRKLKDVSIAEKYFEAKLGLKEELFLESK